MEYKIEETFEASNGIIVTCKENIYLHSMCTKCQLLRACEGIKCTKSERSDNTDVYFLMATDEERSKYLNK
jgi:hypothetical protein